MPISLRTIETEAKYQEWLKKPKEQKCCFCREINNYIDNKPTAIKDIWNSWVLMKNDFPYDGVFEVHDLFFPKHHKEFRELSLFEIEEYYQILKTLKYNYHQMSENIGKRISQPGHFHIHLTKFLAE